MAMSKSLTLLNLMLLTFVLNGCDSDNTLVEIILYPYDSLFNINSEERIIEYLTDLDFNCTIQSVDTCARTTNTGSSSSSSMQVVEFYNYSLHEYTIFEDGKTSNGTYYNMHKYSILNGIVDSGGFFFSDNFLYYSDYDARFVYETNQLTYSSDYSEGYREIFPKSIIEIRIDSMVRFVENLILNIYDESILEFMEDSA